MNAAAEIVRALAAADPAFDPDRATSDDLKCALCGVELAMTYYLPPKDKWHGQEEEVRKQPHADDCPWRLAREWVRSTASNAS